MSYVTREKKRMANNVSCNYQKAYDTYGDNFANFYKNYLSNCGYDANGCRYKNGTTSFVNVGDVTRDYLKLICPVLSDVQSATDAASQAEQQRISDATQAANIGRNAGLGNSRAGLLGESCSGTNTSNVYSNAYTASAQNQGSTQADYLMKMGQACALCNCAQNMNNGALMNALGAAFQGAGSGAKLGTSMVS
jgi:hypothetical protein